MKIGPKYKIARRLGAPVFEKTQTQKYVLHQQRKEKTSRRRGMSRPKSDYGKQLLEKQKARYTYILSEKQFSKYVKAALAKKDTNTTTRLFQALESRIDNVVFRAGFAPTRMAAKQMVSHGHIMFNGRKVTIPSISLKEGDEISIRPQSLEKPLFADLKERIRTIQTPNWIAFDEKSNTAKIKGKPVYNPIDLMFDLNVVLEFYSR